jgi:hypothetical protein
VTPFANLAPGKIMHKTLRWGSNHTILYRQQMRTGGRGFAYG